MNDSEEQNNIFDIDDCLNNIPNTENTVDVSSRYEKLEIQTKELELQKKAAEVQTVLLKNKHLEGLNAADNQDREQRKDFAGTIYHLVCVHLAFVFMILFFQGFSYCRFELSDTVLVTLLGTTTANVITLLVIVVTYFFSKKKK